jgi:dTDP-4-amino-4,6-dideoxy-D-glucose acyltransferase
MTKEFDYRLLQGVGKHSFISSNVEIRRPHLVSIGNNVAIDSGFYLTTAARIDNYVHIGPYVTCIGGADARVKIGNFATIAAGSRLICLGDEHLGAGLVGPTIPKEYRDNLLGGFINIEDFASLSTNCVIFPGVTVGEGSVIGAGSVVKKDTEPWTIYAGNPARAIKSRESINMRKFGEALLFGKDEQSS